MSVPPGFQILEERKETVSPEGVRAVTIEVSYLATEATFMATLDIPKGRARQIFGQPKDYPAHFPPGGGKFYKLDRVSMGRVTAIIIPTDLPFQLLPRIE